MTANRTRIAANATAPILCDQDEFGKAIGSTIGTAGTAESVVLVFDLVEERITQAVGVGVPLARPLVGGKRRLP